MGELRLELLYDSTVEPFSSLKFNFDTVRSLIRALEERGVEVKIIDTAGWSRRMLLEEFRRASTSGREIHSIFGAGRREGWFFGREAPALLLVKEGRVIDVYPHIEGGSIVTVEDGIRRILRCMEVGR